MTSQLVTKQVQNKTFKMDWNKIISKCNSENLLKPPFGRRIHLIDEKYVCKITDGKVDWDNYSYIPREYAPSVEDILQRDKNEVKILQQLDNLEFVPKILYNKENVVIQSYIRGNTLMEVWKNMDKEAIEKIKLEIVQIFANLRYNKVDTLPVKLDKRYGDAFNGETVFVHSDLNLDNIIVKDGKLQGIVDWEYAGYYNIDAISRINKDMCHRGRSLGLDLWANLYDLMGKDFC